MASPPTQRTGQGTKKYAWYIYEMLSHMFLSLSLPAFVCTGLFLLCTIDDRSNVINSEVQKVAFITTFGYHTSTPYSIRDEVAS